MDYEKSMKRCIELAKMGYGNVSPNPLVGCVVYDSFGNLLSEGYHKKYSQNHAERDALLKLEPYQTIGGTLVVNLEPCSHYGKTPPCADLIIQYGIKRVVIGMRDVNPIVAGNGIKKLKDAGIEIIEGVLEKECRYLNEIFIKNMLKNQLFIAIKTASTLDGKIAAYNGSSKWITSECARSEVKVIRNMYDAIITSSSTVIADNPSMGHKCNIIIDRNLKTLQNDYKIYKNKRVIVFYDEQIELSESDICAEFVKAPLNGGTIDLEFVFNKLYAIGLKSVLIEAGGHLNGSALEFTDKIYHFIAPKILGDNFGLSCFNFRRADNINLCNRFHIENIKTFEPDILLTYYPIDND